MYGRLHASNLLEIADKLDAGERLTLDDGRRLFACRDLLMVGWLANRRRETLHAGGTSMYVGASPLLALDGISSVHALSIMHDGLQPSPATRPPSSHSSYGFGPVTDLGLSSSA